MKKALPLLLLALLNSCSLFQGPRGPLTQEEKTVLGTAMPEMELRSGPMYHGQDILGLSMQNLKMIKANLENGQCIGAFAGTFGGILSPLDSLLSTGKVPCFRVHIGGFCKHGAGCEPGECKPTDLHCLKSKSALIEGLVQKYPGVKCFISPYAEYGEKSRGRVESWFRVIHEGAPSCTLVSNPLGGYLYPGALHEKHGNNPGPVAATSNDGSNYFDSDSVKYNGYASVLSLTWTNRYNLRLTSEKGNPPPPRKRNKANRIGENDFRAIQLMQHPLAPRPPAPAVCHGIKGFTGHDLIKPHSEDYPPPAAHSNKFLLISRNGSGNLNMYAPSGKLISVLHYGGSYADPGYNRHYSDYHAYELYKKAGGEWAFIKEGSQCRPVTVLRRQGYFR